MLTSFLNKLGRRPAPDIPRLAPAFPFVAIGDIHGRSDLLAALLERLDPGLPVICVGDYIDRGDHSADVLRMLRARAGTTCLMGNHEEMLLKFLENPEEHGPRWLRYGGLQTVASFGVTEVTEMSSGKALRDARDKLVAGMGHGMIAWLDSLPLMWQSGNIVVSHAGLDPDHAVEMQSDRALLWGHPDFDARPRSDGTWVLHGHRIVDAPFAEKGQIAIDTGAYATGRLTAAVVTAGGVEFLST